MSTVSTASILACQDCNASWCLQPADRTYCWSVQEVKGKHIHWQRQTLQRQHSGEQGCALDLGHGHIGHVPLKGLGGVEAVALAGACAACTACPLHCLDPAPHYY